MPGPSFGFLEMIRLMTYWSASSVAPFLPITSPDSGPCASRMTRSPSSNALTSASMPMRSSISRSIFAAASRFSASALFSTDMRLSSRIRTGGRSEREARDRNRQRRWHALRLNHRGLERGFRRYLPDLLDLVDSGDLVGHLHDGRQLARGGGADRGGRSLWGRAPRSMTGRSRVHASGPARAGRLATHRRRHLARAGGALSCASLGRRAALALIPCGLTRVGRLRHGG